MTRSIWLILIVWVAALALSGCSGSGQPADQKAQTTRPVATSQDMEVSPNPTQPVASEEPYPARDSTNRTGKPIEPYLYPDMLVTPTPIPTPTTLPTLSVGVLPPRLAPGSPVTISSIDMIDAYSGWAIGGRQDPGDLVLRTRDGGQTWVDVRPPQAALLTTYFLNPVIGFFPDAGKGWVTFASDRLENFVWRTQDGGQTWSRGRPVPNDSLERYTPRFLLFVDDDHGWLWLSGIGLGHEYVSLFATTDGGESWTKLFDPNDPDPGVYIHSCWKTGLRFTNVQTGWLSVDCSGLVENGAELIQTNDGGRTWESRQLPPPEGVPDLFRQFPSCGLHSPNLFSPQSGSFVLKCLSLDDQGQIQQFFYGTADGGQHWFTSPYPGGELVMSSPSSGWAFGRDIYQTRNGGQSWTKVKTVNWKGQFDFVDDVHGFAVARSGEHTALVRTDDGGLTWQLIEPVVALGKIE